MSKTNYVPSVNILRDNARNISYIPTPNANAIVNQMVDDFKKGLRAFTIIGSYGTGKSSFLLALEQTLRKQKPYFKANFIQNPRFDSIKLVGEFKSLVDAFAERFNLKHVDITPENILQEIFNIYYDLGKSNPLLIIEIDEFGKFLEYASKFNSEKELYFIQQLAEFVGNPERNIFLVTTIHQSFESYAYSLSSSERQEWTKVKGRFKEITFNEPVEQLLFLAAEYIQTKNEYIPSKKVLGKALQIFKDSKAFSFNNEYADKIFNVIYPLDLVAANVLTLSLQRYGQNERSLFSFLESTDFTSLSKFNSKKDAFYNVASVFEYLNFNFYSFLTSKYNPDFAAWSSIRAALETVERAYDSHLIEYQKIIKIVGLLNIYSASGSIIDYKFIQDYCLNCVKIENADLLLNSLVEKRILRYRSHSKRFVLYEGTDLDIQSALIEAGNKVSEITDVPTLLKKHFDFSPILTKAYSFETGTPRYFKYIFSEVPLNPLMEDDVDGYINLIFSDELDFSGIKSYSLNIEDAIIYGYYRNAKEIKSLLYEIEKTQKVIDENNDDRIAQKELNNILSSQQSLLSHYILNKLFGNGADVVWIHKGQILQIDSRKLFNRQLSQICSQVYFGTPIFRNELVNRPKLSGSVFHAKKNFFTALIDNWDKPDLGFDSEKFPPEKTIYLTLLKENGLSTYSESLNEISVRSDSSFYQLWNASTIFLNTCKDGQRNLIELVDILRSKPFRLKQGLIEFWVPTFLFLKRNDFALFNSNVFIPEFKTEILDLISKSPEDYYIKSFDIEGVKLDIFNSYRIFLDQDIKDSITSSSFIETIKPFLVFYRSLPEYSKNTKRLSKDALAIKTAIANSKDPEKSFFEDFPLALGTSVSQLQDDIDGLQNFSQALQKSIKEIRTSFDKLIERLEVFIQDEIIGEKLNFEEYKNALKKRYKSLKRHLLLPHQKVFIQRIDSALDDKNAWLSSIAQAVMGKALNSFRDEDEILFYDKLQNIIFEIDSLTKLSKAEVDEMNEDILGIQFDSFISGVKRNLIRVPKNKAREIEKAKANISNNLSENRIVNIAALTKLLQELMG